MKWTSFSLTLFLSLSVLAPLAAQPALMGTTSFEAGEPPFSRWTPQTWEPDGAPKASLRLDDQCGHTGKCSLRVDSTGSESQGYWNGPQLPVVPGVRYRATVWIRSELATGAIARMQMGFRDRNGEVVVAEGRRWYEGWTSTPVTGVRDWVQTGVIAKAPAGAVTVSISVKLIGSGTAWFDDAEIARGEEPVPAPSPTLAGASSLTLASPVSGAEPAQLTLKNPFNEPLQDLAITLSGPSSATAQVASLAPGAAAKVILPFTRALAVPQEHARFDARIVYRRSGKSETERMLLFADVVPQTILEAIRSGQQVTLPEKATNGEAQADLLGLAIGPAGNRHFAFPSTAIAANATADGFTLMARLRNPGAAARDLTVEYETLDYFWRGERARRTFSLKPGEVLLTPLPVSAAVGKNILRAGETARADTFRVLLRVGTRRSQRDVKVTLPAEPLAKLPPLPEKQVSLPPYGTLRLIDDVDLGDAADPHSLREGGKGLYAKYSSEPLDRYDGVHLTYDWEPAYRDSRERFTAIQEIAGKRCRVANNWGWFGVYIGRGQLKNGRYYVAELEYPEDTARSFNIWNTINSLASFGFHTGSSLGDPFSRQRFIEQSAYPLSGQYRCWRSLFRSTTDGSGWFFIHSMGNHADPYNAGIAVSHLRLYELGETEALAKLALKPAVALPPDLPRRHFIFLQEDLPATAGCLPELQFYGFDTYSPLALSYAGGTYSTNSGYIDWPSKLFGQGGPVNNPHAQANPLYYRQNSSPTRYEQTLAAAKEQGMSMLPCLEYAGTGQLPAEALAVDPDGTPSRYYWGSERLPDGSSRPRRLADGTCIDMAHPAVGDDLCRIIEEVAGNYLKEYPNLIGVELTHRFNAWQISYSNYEIDRFSKETGITVPGATQPERAAWIFAHKLREYVAFHTEKKRENLLRARDCLRRLRPDLTLFVLNWVGGDDGLPFGNILWFQGHEQGDEFLIPGKPYLMEKGKRDLSVLQEDFSRPEVRMQSVPLQPRRYRNDAGILNWAVGHYRFTADNADYLGNFRTGSGLAFCDWWIYNEDCGKNNPAIGWNCPGLHGNEHAGRFCMTEEICAVASADPVMMGIRMGAMNRGFVEAPRRFAAAYRALPALPSTVMPGAFPDKDVVVRRIPTHYGDYYAIADRRLALSDRAAPLRLPAKRPAARVVDLTTGRILPFKQRQGALILPWRSEAMSLSALRVEYRRKTAVDSKEFRIGEYD